MRLLPTLLCIAALLTAPASAQSLPGLNAELCGSADPFARSARETLEIGRASAFTSHAADPRLPWVAKLQIVERDLPGGYMEVQNCGASVLSPHWLLTAGHCVRSTRWKRVEVTLGALDVGDSRAIRNVAVDAVCHSGFNPVTMADDVALLRLEHPLPFDVPVVRLDVPDRFPGGPLPPRGALAVAAGWRTHLDGTADNTMRRSYGRIDGPSAALGLMAVRPLANDPYPLCLGESGAPLVLADDPARRQIAILTSVEARVASDGSTPFNYTDCIRGGFRLTFARIGHYRRWIDSVIAHCTARPETCRRH